MLLFKLTILLLLVSSQRGQTILNLAVDRNTVGDRMITFKMKVLLKYNQLGQPLDSIRFHAYLTEKKLCVIRPIRSYLSKTKTIRRNNSQWLLSYIGPHEPISRATLARWTINVLKLGGVNVEKYMVHSTRGTSASSAQTMGANCHYEECLMERYTKFC